MENYNIIIIFINYLVIFFFAFTNFIKMRRIGTFLSKYFININRKLKFDFISKKIKAKLLFTVCPSQYKCNLYTLPYYY